MVIHVLSDEVASQIAAGEVIERPASVVKELLENSIDAQASNIQIKIEGAGTSLIEIADDGVGIDPSDMQLAVARHATSKLSTAEDLQKVETLGFRGEALASIGSVSHLAITSRVKSEQTGIRIRVDGGKILPTKELGSPEGTVVRVEDLFYNVPVRRKFLKTERTERNHIVALVSKYALAYPKIRINLIQENRKVLSTNGNGDRREVISSLYGIEIAKQMIQVLSDEDKLKITGYISPNTLTRSNRKEMQFFINGRPIQDSALSTALIQAYRTMLMVGRFPMAILFLEMPPEMVDVNVHPAKSEVRFQDQNHVFRGIGRSARKALLANIPVPDIGGGGYPFGQSPIWQQYLLQKKTENDPAWGMAGELNQNNQSSFRPAITISGQKDFTDASVPLLRLIGQVAALYLVSEGPDGLYLIDQHAAHERILYEKIMAHNHSEIPVQTLLAPVTVELPHGDAGIIEESLPILIKYGFQIESFGKNTFLIRGIPSLLSDVEPSALIRSVVDGLDEDESPLANEVEAKIISRVCKRAAVKAGQILSWDEQEALLRDLEKCVVPRTCPHGRPTMIHLSVDLLARQFGRR